MRIILTEEDLNALPESVLEAIFGRIGLSASTSTMGGSPQGQQLAEMGKEMFSRFMAGVSATTRSCMKVFVENNGVVTPSQLLAATGYAEPGQLRGFQAGVTRRTRKLMGAPTAYLIGWKQKSDKHWDGEFYVAPTTLRSMKSFFNVE